MILGLDIGSNSVGWCLIETDAADRPVAIKAAGVRCFAAGVTGAIDQGREESRSAKRRQARLARRQTWRRQRRRKKLFCLLQRLDLLPAACASDPTSIHACLVELDRSIRQMDPETNSHRGQQVILYRLRARALSERLERHHLGRALYHLAQRRGFLSNRKDAKSAEDDDERGQVKEGVARLADAMAASGKPTLGAYFATLDSGEERIRTRWTSRQMYLDEFDAIWRAQARHHCDLSEDVRRQVHRAIFFQRPLRDQSDLIGHCELEPAERRARRADPVFQEFRLLQTVNNLRVALPGEPPRPLTAAERSSLSAVLEREGDQMRSAVKRLLGLSSKARLSIEEGGETKIRGNRTHAALRRIFGEKWEEFGEAERRSVLEDLLSFEKTDALKKRAIRHWHLPPDVAAEFAELELEDDFANLSLEAMRTLLPCLKEGKSYAEAVKEKYPSAFQASATFERLPPVLSADGYPDLRNPTVLRALTEVRKVVNAVIDRFGKPRAVRIELARDLKRSRKQRKEQWAQMRDQESLRRAAAERIAREAHIANPSRRDIEKVLLANECEWRCPFTGESISMRDLVGDAPRFDVEHIIPFSRSLDDGFFNKTLCLHEENRRVKGNRTPFEAYATTPRWQEIVARVRAFTGRAASEKLRRFLLEDVGEELGDQFTDRHLNDTRHASRLAAGYLGRLYGGSVDEGRRRRVQATSGSLTAFLRGRWELNKLLDDGDVKTRLDHRHHAVDALVIALTTPAAVKALADAAEKAEGLGRRRLFAEVDPPWDGFLDDAQRVISEIVVSHRVDRRLNGALHEETIYGKERPRLGPRGETQTVRHLRKPLAALSETEIEEIVDPGARARVRARLDELRARDPRLAKPAKAFADPANHPVIETSDGRRIPIHRARIRKAVRPVAIGRGASVRHVAPGSNHHMAFVAVLDEQGNEVRWEGHVVTRLEAIERWRRSEPVVQRDWGVGRRFLFALTSGDSIRLQLADRGETICTVRTVSGSNIEATIHSDARTVTQIREAGKAGGRLRFGVEALRAAQCRKVNVGVMGEVTVAGD